MRRALSSFRRAPDAHAAFVALGLSSSLALLAPGTGLGPTCALAWVETAPPLQHPELYPGLQPIIEFDGNVIHNCGNTLVNITNFGLIGSTPDQPRFRWSSAPSLQWPAGSGIEYLFAAALWIGAEKEGENVVTTGAFPFECLPGLTPIQRIYRTREGAPGGARAPSPNADDDRDGRTNEDVLNGADDDGDGRIDEDFAAVSNQMFFSEYSDTDPSIKLAFPEHTPIGVLIQQASYCWEDRALDDFIAFDFKIINVNPDPLFDVYIGFFVDSDIGPRGPSGNGIANDDLAGFWEGVETARVGTGSKKVKLSLGYMFDEDGDEGRTPGYVGVVFLGAQDPAATSSSSYVPMHNFRYFSGSAAFDQGGDPSNDEESYSILDGTAPRSLPPPRDLDDLRPEQLARRPDDYRMVVSAGPFPFVDRGDTIGFQAALVVGHGFEGMRENAVQAQLTFDGVWLDCDKNQTTGVFGRETAVCGPELAGQVLRINECDSLCDFAPPSDPGCFVNVPMDGCEWVNDDCALERWTEFPTGVDGQECLIHWLVSTAPPPPRMRVHTSADRVDVFWDNTSETSPDLKTNILDFESYRVWRADNWTRPLGTDERIGPGADLWMLLAEFDLANNRVGSESGLDGIVYVPRIPDSAVEFYREWFAAHPFLQPPDLPGFTPDQIDTAKAVSKGVHYYQYTDPPFMKSGCANNPNDPGDCVIVSCGPDGTCPPVVTSRGLVHTRCNAAGQCQEVFPPPHAGAHYFYSVTATDHKVELRGEQQVIVGAGLAGDPSSNFIYVNPVTNALPRESWANAEGEIYVVPNPATRESLDDWRLEPNNEDPTGIKVEFHNLPRTRGQISVFTLSSDLIIELPFDGTTGNGSMAWDLLSRNGQEVTSGIYLYVVEADSFDRFVGKLAIIR